MVVNSHSGHPTARDLLCKATFVALHLSVDQGPPPFPLPQYGLAGDALPGLELGLPNQPYN